MVEVEYQVPFKVTVRNSHICKYLLDFRVTYADDHIEHHDVKGYATEVYKLKKKLVEAIYGIKILEK